MAPASPEQDFPDDTLPSIDGRPSSEPACSLLQRDEDPYQSHTGSLLSELYSDDPLPFIVPSHEDYDYSTFEDSYFSFGPSITEGWELTQSLLEFGHTYGL